MKTKSLEDKNFKYTALSYTWGSALATGTSDAPAKVIIVNNKPFQVTENLYSALWHLQADEISPGIWIDSVCIDQTNNDEKMEQIQRMRSIYDSATCVLVWLGPAANESDCVMNLILKIGNQCLEFKLPEINSSGFRVWPASPNDERRLKLREIFDEFLNREGHLKIVKAFAAFSERRWWKRVWIVQELAVSRDVIFVCGKKKAPHDAFDAAVIFWHHWVGETVQQKVKIHTLSELNQLDKDDFFHSLARGSFGLTARSILGYRSKYQKRKAEHKSITLYEALNQAYTRSSSDTTPLQATEDKDRIFALVGLVQQDYYETLKLSLHYDAMPESWGVLTEGELIYIKTAEALLKAGHIDLLGLFQYGKVFDQHQTLPSWCPDWRKELWQSNTVNGNLGESEYRASQTKQARFSRFVQFSSETKTVTISGLLIGPITEVRPRLNDSERLRGHKDNYFIDSTPEGNIFPMCARLFSDLSDLCAASATLEPNVYSRHDLEEAIWRVPVRDYEMSPGSFLDKPARRIFIRGGELPPGSLNKDADRTSNQISEIRYRKFRSLVSAFEAFAKLQDSYERPDRISTVSKIILRLFWILKCIFLIGNYALARFHGLSRSRWWIKNRLLIAWTWASSREAGPALSDLKHEMAIEWENIVCDTPELYLVTMGMNYPMKLFMTKQGYIGLGPATLQEDDVVCILFGANTPHILRPRSQDGGQRGYYVIGEAYVYGVMDGQFLDEATQEPENFVLF